MVKWTRSTLGVRFQEVAPHALAGVRFARDEQHLQLVAHALDRHHGLVVQRRQFVGQRVDIEFDDIRAAVLDADRHVEPGARRRTQRRDEHAVASHAQHHRLAPARRVDHAQRDRLVLADDAEARGVEEFDAPVALAGMAGDERMKGSMEAERGGGGRHVVHDPVGDREHRADALGRHVGEALVQRLEQLRAVVRAVAAPEFDRAHLDVAECGKLRLQACERRIRLHGSLADRLAAAAVHDHGDDILQPVAVLAHQRRACERQQDRGEAEATQPRRAPPRPEAERQRDDGEQRQREQQLRRDERRERQRELLHKLRRDGDALFLSAEPGFFADRRRRGDTMAGRLVLFVDGDACPVKAEAFRVAARYGLMTYVVANAPLLVPRDPRIERVLVPQGPDVADDWIAERAAPGAVVVTADVPLAARCVRAGADVLAPNGRAFTPDSVGMALATRNLMSDLREAGHVTGGPKPFSPRDRSAFLSALDMIVVRLKRRGFAPDAPA